MIAVTTADMIGSTEIGPEVWMPKLKRFLQKLGRSPENWEIFRGDSFQYRCEPSQAFIQFLLLKSLVKQIPRLDVRVSIGIGDVNYEATHITQSNGTAFVNSGRTLDAMKEKEYLAFCTGRQEVDNALNLFGRFLSVIVDHWSPAAAMAAEAVLENPDWSQSKIAEKLKVRQSAVSQSLSRAKLDLLMDFNQYYVSTVNTIAS